jgi:hypothetical protein
MTVPEMVPTDWANAAPAQREVKATISVAMRTNGLFMVSTLLLGPRRRSAGGGSCDGEKRLSATKLITFTDYLSTFAF